MHNNEGFVPEIKSLEQLPKDTRESFLLGGIQSVEHIINTTVEKDVFTNETVPMFLSEYFRNLYEISEKKDTVFPLDNILQIGYYIEKSLKKILFNPKFKIEKQEVSVHYSKIKTLDPKALRWLGTQPGRTIREKLGNSEKIRTRMSRYSYNTKENIVVSQFVNLILGILKKKVEKYKGKLEIRDEEYERFYNYYLNLIRNFRNSELSEVVGRFDNIPNNTLIGDRNYSVVYRGHLQLKRYRQQLKKEWENSFNRFVTMVFMTLAGRIANGKNIYYEDELIKILDCGDEISIVDSEENTHNLYNIEFMVKHSNDTWQDDQGREKGVIEKNSTIICYAVTEHGYKVVDIRRKKEMKKLYLSLKKDNNCDGESMSIFLKLGQWYAQRRVKFRLESNYEDEKPYIKLFINGKERDERFDTDIKDFNRVVSLIEKYSLDELFLNSEKKEEAQFEKMDTSDMSIDFTGFQPIIYNGSFADGEFCKRLKSLRAPWKGNDRYFLAGDGFYKNSVEIIAMNRIFENEESGTLPFEKALDELFRYMNIEENSYLTFSVPDNMDEFRQGPLKGIIESRYKKSFPVWRSISAGIAWYKKFNNKLGVGDSIIVVDLNNSSVSATRLELIETRDGNRFKHYPCFNEEFEYNRGSSLSFLQRYVDRATLKLKIFEDKKQNLIQAGVAQRVIKTRAEEMFNGDGGFIKLRYNRAEYLDIFKEVKVELKKFTDFLVQKYLSHEKNVPIVILCSYINEDSKATLDENQYFISDEEVTEGGYEISRRLKNGEFTWEEYLPTLSLEITENGCYGELPLTQGQQMEVKYGGNMEIEIPGKLTLPKGKKSYSFPLVKAEGENSDNYTRYEAKIESEKFPLLEDIRVNLKIFYSYGVENNYRLMIYPDGKENQPFKELEANWKEVKSKFKFNQMEIPEIEVGSRTANTYYNSLNRLNKDCEKLLHWIVDSRRVTNNFYPLQVINRMWNLKNSIRSCRLKYYNQYNEETLAWLQLNNEIEKNARLLLQEFKNPQTLKRFRTECENNKIKVAYGRELGVIQIFLCALGKNNGVDIHTKKYSKLFDDDIRAIGHVLSGEYDKALVSKLFKVLEKGSNQGDVVVEVLAGVVKYNHDFLPKIRDMVVNDIPAREFLVRVVMKQIEEIWEQCNEKQEAIRAGNYEPWRILEPYRKCCELLLYLLNDRTLKLNMENRYRIAGNIKKIDRFINEENLKSEYQGKINFDIPSSAKEGLENMLDMSFAIIQQLIGENKTNLITISKVSDD